MNKDLQISNELGLPRDLVTTTTAIIGIKGSGKTVTAKVLNEEMLNAGLQTVALDPTGVWWGLRSNAAGDGPGKSVAIIGGRRRDSVPIDIEVTPAQGALVAEMIVRERMSAVLDMRAYSRQEKILFAAAFAARLLEINEYPLHLFADEADLFAPKAPLYKGAADALVSFDDLARQGRVYGIGTSFISQRPQLVHNNVLSMAEVLIVLRVIGANDIAALDAWIGGNAGKAQRAEVVAKLPTLGVGEAVVWSPTLGILNTVQMRMLETFDSSATPKAGEQLHRPRAFTSMDYERLREQFGAVIHDNDPAALRRRIEELTAENKGLKADKADRTGADRAPAPQVVTRTRQLPFVVPVGVPVITEEALASLLPRLDRLGEAIDIAAGVGKDIGALHGLLKSITSDSVPNLPVEVYNTDVKDLALGGPPVDHSPGNGSNEDQAQSFASPVALTSPAIKGRKRPPAPVQPSASLTVPQQRILDALAEFKAVGLPRIDRSNLAAWAGYSPTSGGFKNYLGQLRTAGLISYPSDGEVSLTDQGSELAHASDAPKTRQALLDRWLQRLPGSQGRVLSAVVQCWPASVSREYIAKEVGLTVTSGGFKNYLGALRSLGLIDYPGPGSVAATDLLFPEGLP